MSSRQEEKERRRQERLAAEAAAKKSADRRKRLGIVLGGLLAAVVAGIVAFAVLGGDDGGGGSDAAAAGVPPVRTTDLNEAARLARCRVGEHDEEGRDHTSEAVRYRTNPPTSGDHEDVASREGVYGQGNSPDLEQSVHALEHGRVLIQYRPGTPPQRASQLEALFEEKVKGIEGYKTLVFENQSRMPHAVAATSWTKSLTCPEFNDQVFDAVRAFRKANVDQAPESNIPSEFGQ